MHVIIHELHLKVLTFNEFQIYPLSGGIKRGVLGGIVTWKYAEE